MPKKIVWLLAIVIIILIIFLPSYTKLQELKDKNKQLQARIEQIELDNARLEGEILRFQQDPVYREEIIRDKLGVVRKGEVLYKIEPEE
ncbi:MAG: septum formation initiator family protein [Candidatus Omnitrophota bacterium]|jgi:cell division protein FtsB